MNRPKFRVHSFLFATAAAMLLAFVATGCQCNKPTPQNPGPHNGAEGKEMVANPGPHN